MNIQKIFKWMFVTGLSVNKNFKSKWASSTKCDKCFEIQQKCKTKFFTWSPAKSNAKILKMWQSTQNFATWPIFELQKWFSTFWKWQSKASSKVAKRFNKSDRQMLQNSIGENLAKLSLEIVAEFGREKFGREKFGREKFSREKFGRKCCRNRPENIAKIGRKTLQNLAKKICCKVRPRKVRPENVI